MMVKEDHMICRQALLLLAYQYIRKDPDMHHVQYRLRIVSC